MSRRDIASLVLASVAVLFAVGCSGGKSDPQAEAPPPLKVERVEDRNVFQVDHPERFPLAQAVEHIAAATAEGHRHCESGHFKSRSRRSLWPTGRVVEIDARLGDTVKKGQLLLKVQSADISGAFSDYQKAVADEQLARHATGARKASLRQRRDFPERSSSRARCGSQSQGRREDYCREAPRAGLAQP